MKIGDEVYKINNHGMIQGELLTIFQTKDGTFHAIVEGVVLYVVTMDGLKKKKNNGERSQDKVGHGNISDVQTPDRPLQRLARRGEPKELPECLLSLQRRSPGLRNKR